MTEKQKTELKVAELTVLRSFILVSRMDRIRDDYIRGLTVWKSYEGVQVKMVWTYAEER